MLNKTYICCFAILIIFASSTHGDELLSRRFKKEYPTASQKLQELYSHLRMSGTEKREDDVKNWAFRGNENSLCSIMKMKDGRSSVIVANAKQSFTLEKSSESRNYTVTSLGTASEQDLKELSQTILKRAFPVAVSYTIMTEPIVEFISDKSFKLINSSENERPDGKSIKIEWENSPPNGPKRRGSFEFSDVSWALLSYDLYFLDVKAPDSNQKWIIGRHGVIEYDGLKNGIPLVRRVRTWNSGPGGKSPETIMEVLEIVPGQVSQEEFELGAFGISSAPIAESSPIAYYLFAMSGATGLLVLVIRFLQSRDKSAIHSA